MTGTLHDGVSVLMRISRSSILRMRNISDISLEKIKTRILFSVKFFPKNPVVYNIIYKKMCTSGGATDENIIRLMRFACWTTKTKNTHSEYVRLIGFPWKIWLLDCASLLGCTYFVSFV